MRFLKINMSHPIIFDKFYEKYDKNLKLSPEKWLALFFEEHYWPSNSFEKYLEKDFGMEVITIPLTYDRKNPNYIHFLNNVITKIYQIEFDTSKQNTCIQNMITYFNPEILYLQEAIFYSKEYLQSTRENCTNLKLIVGWNCAPCSIGDMEKLIGFDLIFTCSKEYYLEMQSYGINSVLLGHSFDKDLLPLLNTAQKKYDVTFTGHINGKDYRKNILQELINNGINVGLFVEENAQQYFDIPIKGQVFGLEMYQTIADSKIVLNIHPTDDVRYSGNIRLYEVTGVGSLLLTDYKDDLHKKFNLETDIVTFKDVKQAVEKIKYLLQHDEIRERIAQSGQQKTLTDFAYKKRTQIMYDAIKNTLKKNNDI